MQYRDIIRDRPTICIPDDHDVGHGNVWGESGKRSAIPGDADGGYKFPVKYVNQVQRQQTFVCRIQRIPSRSIAALACTSRA